jgi:hypothetical protein
MDFLLLEPDNQAVPIWDQEVHHEYHEGEAEDECVMRKEKPCALVVDRNDCELVLTLDLIVQELVPDDLHRKVEDDERNVEDGDDLNLIVQAV